MAQRTSSRRASARSVAISSSRKLCSRSRSERNPDSTAGGTPGARDPAGMKYRVAFRKRFNQAGEPADEPAALVDPAEGVILAKERIEILEPPSIHASEDIDAGSGSESGEDDGFLGFGTETWVYDVADGRDQEFKDALLETELVLDIEEIPDESLTT